RAGRPFASAGVTEAPQARRADPVSVFREVGFAGDLDGDARSDVVELAQTVRWQEGTSVSAHFDVTAFDGDTGRRLWRSRVTAPELACRHRTCGYVYREGYAYATDPAAGAGIEVVVFSVLSDHPGTYDAGNPATWPVSSHGFTVAFDVARLDRRGGTAWSRHFEGRFDVEWQRVTMTHVPVVQGAGLIESKGFDWVLTVSDGLLVSNLTTRMNLAQALGPAGVAPFVPDGHLFSSRAVVVNGRTGAIRDVGPPAYGLPAVRDLAPVGDLSGDGRDDLVETHPAADDWFHLNRNGAGDGLVSAIRSSDGTTLWRAAAGAAALTATPVAVTGVGDVTGDRRTDVAVRLRAGGDGAPPLVLLDGATGQVAWEKEGHTALGVGNATRTGRAAVVLAGVTGARVTVAAYDAAGARTWASEVPVRGIGDAEVAAAYVYGAGDLDADGVTDVDVRAVVVTTLGRTTVVDVLGVAFVSGRTGRALPRVRDEEVMSGPLDRRGADAFTSHATGVTVRAGQTARPLWRVDFGRPVFAAVADTDGTPGRCGRLLVSGYYIGTGAGYRVVTALFDRTGRLLWTRTFGAAADARPRTVAKTFRC
ncbi:MAG TPA: hypothetical protein VNA20_08905, partial [Frankiaceae bacterium]|nr:hypothetical protein [Frankiaceae bacterium]